MEICLETMDKVVDSNSKEVKDPEFQAYRCYLDLNKTTPHVNVEDLRIGAGKKIVISYNINGCGIRSTKSSRLIDAFA